MRVLRTILGLLLLTIGLPALLVGAGFWAALQHRDAGGAFTGALQNIVTPGYAVVVDDADALLSADAPFARGADTRLRLTAQTPDGPAFVGIAPAADVDRYLGDVPRQTVKSIDIGTGTLPVASERIAGSRAPTTVPGQAGIWLKAGDGQLDWNPSQLRDSAYSLVIMSPSARPGLSLTATAAVSPGWLNTTTWALIMLGSLATMAGVILAAWPGRRREIVYVVEPSQVPDLIRAIGAPSPLPTLAARPGGGGRHTGAHRPRTLADATPKASPAQLTWPPAGAPASSSETVATTPPSPSNYAAVTAIPAGSAGSRSTPAPGEPLGLIGSVTSGLAGASALLGSPASALTPPAGGGAMPARPGRRRAAHAEDTPVFEAAAVGAWVAETAAARARETEARAAAILAAEALKNERRGAHAAPDDARSSVASAGSVSGQRGPTEWAAAGRIPAESRRVGLTMPGSSAEGRNAQAPGQVGQPAASASAAVTASGVVAAGVVAPDAAASDAMASEAVASVAAANVAAAASVAAGRAGAAVKPDASPVPLQSSEVDTAPAALSTSLEPGPAKSTAEPAVASRISSDGGTAVSTPRPHVPAAATTRPASTPTQATGSLAARVEAAATNTRNTPQASIEAAPAPTLPAGSPVGGRVLAELPPPKTMAAPESTAKPSTAPSSTASEAPHTTVPDAGKPTSEKPPAGAPAGPSGTAPAPPRPMSPIRPTVPAPSRPTTPRRPAGPDPSPTRPAATQKSAETHSSGTAPASPAAQQPAAPQPNVSPTMATASGPADAQPTGGPVGTSRPSAGQRTEAPIQVPLSDRPTTVSQPGSSGLGTKPNRPVTEQATTPPAGQQPGHAGPTLRPAGMNMPPSSTSEIQARLQAAMRPSGTSRTTGAPVGVAGRRDYPATPRRESSESSRGPTRADAATPARAQAPSLGAMPAVGAELGTPAAQGPAAAGKPSPTPKTAAAKAEDDRGPAENGSAAETVASNTAPRGHAHIAEQRVDADRLPPTDEAAKAGDPSLPTAKTKDKAKDAADAVIKSPKSVTATTEKGNPEPAQTDNAQTDNAQTDNAQTDNAQIGNAQIENAQTEKVRAEKVRAEGAQTKKAHADNAQAEKAPAEKAAAGGAKAGKPSPGKAQPKESSAKAQPRTMAEDTPNVPGARLSSYAEEAAELLAGLSANRRRRKPGTDESTADPAHDGAIG